MPARLQSLLQHPEFRARLVVPDGARDASEVSLSWAHSSDLADPTPWLESGQLLLTDGAQFAGVDERFAGEYVRRLVERDIHALGFAIGVIHPAIPPALIDACAEQGLALIEIERETLFISIIRFVASELAAESRARVQWSLDAHRSIARAALSSDGLGAILIELSAQLDCWVALFDSTGAPLHVPGLSAPPAELRQTIEAAAYETLAKGTRAGLSIIHSDVGISLQTIGQRGRLRGVLAVGTSGPLDPAGHEVVESVIGIASIVLEQRRELDAARRQLRTGLLELLMAGEWEVASRTAASVWGSLPAEPIVVTLIAGDGLSPSALDELELEAVRNDRGFFYAERNGDVLLVAGATTPPELRSLIARHGMTAGTSSRVSWADLRVGVSEAAHAARAASPSDPVVDYESLAERGLHGLLRVAGGESVARTLLAPVLQVREPERTVLLETVRVWLENHGAWDPAARALHVHRHTVKSRVETVERMLGVDLGDFAVRAEIWSALELIGDQ